MEFHGFICRRFGEGDFSHPVVSNQWGQNFHPGKSFLRIKQVLAMHPFGTSQGSAHKGEQKEYYIPGDRPVLRLYGLLHWAIGRASGYFVPRVRR